MLLRNCVDITGVDLNEENLKFARQRVISGKFFSNKDSFDFGKFDLIICNFVLVENNSLEMRKILKQISLQMTENSVCFVTNPSGKAYKRENKWFTFNNDFCENYPQDTNDNKQKFKEDQPVKVHILSSEKKSIFTFFDFFHSGASYRTAYNSVGLQLLETHRPLGKNTDGLPWESELKVSPYKIHVLVKKPLSQDHELITSVHIKNT